jgi:hypothetical protein
MSEPFTKKLARGSLKCASYWQSVLRFGLPLVILFQGTDYAAFRMTLGKTGLRYHWGTSLVMDVAFVFLAPTPWWWLMREIAAWKQRNQQG